MPNDMNTRRESLHNQKKKYQSPNLVVYGDIREITKNVGSRGKIDGGKGSNKNSQM